MAEEGAQSVGSGTFSTSVPWNQIPRFTPGETDLRVYTRKLEFLRELWPKEYLEYLAPRAALQVEGAAFQRVSRLDASKLKGPDGVKYLVESLGGQWGRLENEEKLELFEKALYQTVQKSDESNDSYIARHDSSFEDLLTRKVGLEEVRAYILIRQSVLSSEDRKKIVMDCGGALTYEKAKQSIRLLGSKFFQELQTQGKTLPKWKTYETHQVEEESTFVHEEEEIDEETVMLQLIESGDEDACFIQEFEEQVLAACQESADLSACFTSYQEARQRLREKAKYRGFWPLSGKGRGKGKKGRSFAGNAKGSGAGVMSQGLRRRSLADRIANSTCRRCGQAGHWKRECPMATSPKTTSMGKKLNDPDSFTGILFQDDFVPVNDYEIGLAAATDVYEDLPEGAENFDPEWQDLGRCCEGCDEKDFVCEVGFGVQGMVLECECFLSQVPPLSISFSGHLTQKLLQCCRKHDVPCATVVAEPHRATAVNSTDLKQSDLVPESPDLKQSETVTVPSAAIFTAEEADDEAIIDTGASRAVIGMERLRKLINSLPSEVRRKVMKVPTDGVVFKFGNSGRLTSDFAVMLPRAQKGWLRIEVVQGQTPFLISSAVLKGLKAVVDVEGRTLGFRNSGVRIPLVNVRKNLLGVKVMDLLSMAPHVKSAQTHILCAPVLAETNDQNQTDSQHDHGHAHKLHHMHDFHDGIHHTVPKERAVNDDQGKDSVNQQDLSLNAAHFSEQGSHTRGIVPENQNVHHGALRSSSVSRSDVDNTSRSKSADQSESRRAARSSCTPTEYQYPHGLGVSQSTLGQTCEQDLRSHLRAGAGVRQSNVEQTRSLIMGEKFPAVLPGEACSQPRGQAQDGPFDSGIQFSNSDASGAQGDGTRASADSGSADGADRECRERRMDPHSGGNTGARGECQGKAQLGQSDTSDGDPARSGESSAVAGPDCHCATGTPKGDQREPVIQQETLKQFGLSDQLKELTTKIEDGLSTLKFDCAYVSQQNQHWNKRLGKSSKRESVYNQSTKNQRGIDLLEVYCDEHSQLTTQVIQQGGKLCGSLNGMGI